MIFSKLKYILLCLLNSWDFALKPYKLYLGIISIPTYYTYNETIEKEKLSCQNSLNGFYPLVPDQVSFGWIFIFEFWDSFSDSIFYQ